MKKLISLITALTLCCACVGCSTEKKAAVPETATEAVAETIKETQPQETAAETEAVPVLEEPTNGYAKYPNFYFAYEDETKKLEVYDCRMYPSENGTTIFAVDYKTVAGLQAVVCAYADDGDNEPNYWYEVENLTTEEDSTLIFEMKNDLLEQIYQPVVLFRDQYSFFASEIDIFHREQQFTTTEGNPDGEAQELLIEKQGNVTVYSAHMQALDNGYVRFTVDCKPQKDRYISFYNPPEGNRFMFIRYEPTSGQRETIAVDVREEDVADLHNMNFNFFNGDAAVARIYLSSPITQFDELDASQFEGFIGGNGFTLVYYGVIDEAILGATITGEDSTSMEVTEKALEKNGDGHSLVIFKDYKVKKQDTVSITLSKDGYEDISFSVYVH